MLGVKANLEFVASQKLRKNVRLVLLFFVKRIPKLRLTYKWLTTGGEQRNLFFFFERYKKNSSLIQVVRLSSE